MRVKLLSGTAAVALVAGAGVASLSPASAQPWVGPAFVPGGLVAAATSPLWGPGFYDYYPGYVVGPVYAAPRAVVVPSGPGPGAVAYCEAHFRSYDPATGMYLGYDGLHHPCP
jgi:hypothetical protein